MMSHTHIADLVYDKKEHWVIDPKSSLEDALRFLQSKNIQAAPVYDEDAGKYIGILDVWSIFIHLILMYTDVMTSFALGNYFTDVKETGLYTAKIDKEVFKSTTVKDLLQGAEQSRTIYTFEPY